MSRTIAVLAGILTLVPATAGPAAAATNLSLRGAWVRMADRGPEYAMARHRHEAAENNHRAKRLGFYLPKLSFDFTVPTYTNDELNQDVPTGDPLNPYRRQLSSQEMTHLSGALSLSQAVFTGGRLEASGELLRQRRLSNISPDYRSSLGGFTIRFSQPLFRPSVERAELKEAEMELRRSDIDFAEARWQALISITKGYGDWLAAIRDERLAELAAERARLEAAAGEAKYEAGTLKEADLITLRSEQFDAEIAYLDAQSTRTDAEIGLAALIDWPIGDSLRPADSLPDLEPLLGEAPRRPEGTDSLTAIVKAQLELDRQQFALHQQKSRGGLDGTFAANWSKQKEDETALATDSTRSFNTGRWGVSLTLSIPVWDGGAQRAAVQSAELAVEEAEASFKKARREAENHLASAQRRFDTYRRKLDLKHQEMLIAARAQANADRKYEEGLLSDSEHLQAQITAITAEKEYLETKRDYIVAYLDLQNLFVHTRPPL